MKKFIIALVTLVVSILPNVVVAYASTSSGDVPPPGINGLFQDLTDEISYAGNDILDCVRSSLQAAFDAVTNYEQNDESFVKDAIKTLEAKLSEFPILDKVLETIKSIIKKIKEAIIELYANERATVPETTAGSPPAETGSNDGFAIASLITAMLKEAEEKGGIKMNIEWSNSSNEVSLLKKWYKEVYQFNITDEEAYAWLLDEFFDLAKGYSKDVEGPVTIISDGGTEEFPTLQDAMIFGNFGPGNDFTVGFEGGDLIAIADERRYVFKCPSGPIGKFIK